MEDITKITQWMIDVYSSSKKNYQELAKEEIKRFEEEGKRPSLLLQVCCGPCSCYLLTFLCPHFDVTIYYSNSNIYPPSEFTKREGEVEKLIANLKRDYGFDIGLVVAPYDNEAYNKILEPYAESKECGPRCKVCYETRMREAYDYADANGFDYFCTVMTISRQKSSQILNAIGKLLEEEKSHKAKYFYSDFKKEDGVNKGKAIREEYGLYNQDYCGCIYSFNERNERLAKKLDEKE